MPLVFCWPRRILARWATTPVKRVRSTSRSTQHWKHCPTWNLRPLRSSSPSALAIRRHMWPPTASRLHLAPPASWPIGISSAEITFRRSERRCCEVARSRTATHQDRRRSEEHTSELQSQSNLVCRLLLEKKKKKEKDRMEKKQHDTDRTQIR